MKPVRGRVHVLQARRRVKAGQDSTELRDMVRMQAPGIAPLEEALEPPVLESG
jgi:hypothetical protein